MKGLFKLGTQVMMNVLYSLWAFWIGLIIMTPTDLLISDIRDDQEIHSS
jgi:hypothetical protein